MSLTRCRLLVALLKVPDTQLPSRFCLAPSDLGKNSYQLPFPASLRSQLMLTASERVSRSLIGCFAANSLSPLAMTFSNFSVGESFLSSRIFRDASNFAAIVLALPLDILSISFLPSRIISSWSTWAASLTEVAWNQDAYSSSQAETW